MNWIYPIGFLALLFVVAIFSQRVLMKRALNQVVAIFEENRALTPDTARTLEELNLQRRGFLIKPAAFRDYKHRVVETLVNINIVMITRDHTYYLSKSELARSHIRDLLNTSQRL